MLKPRRAFLRLMLLGCVFVSADSLTNPTAVLAEVTAMTALPAAGSEILSMGLPPEVRIRKLHLVRPDLIPYPIASEINC